MLVPNNVTEPLIYLSAKQQPMVAHKFPSIDARYTLPAWVPQRLIAAELGHDTQGMTTALKATKGKPYLWATEFENWHDWWDYDEPALNIGGTPYRNSEHFYQAQKPHPFKEKDWNQKRDNVMRIAIRAKLEADPKLRVLLAATKGHPLLAIKMDSYWGVDPVAGGRNRLAELWMELRALLP